MTDLFKHIHHAWRTREEDDIGLCFYSYLLEYSTLGDIELMFNAKRDEMNASPCCARHSGSFPISVNSMQDTPFVGGHGCDRSIRHYIRILRMAAIALSGGENPDAFQTAQDDASIREI